MGFGFLFVGYLLAFGFTSGANYIVSLVGLIGSIFLLVASHKLSLYSKSFSVCKYFAASLGMSYILNTASQLSSAYLMIDNMAILVRICRALIIASVFLFNLFMYKGIASIAITTEDKKLTVGAYRDLILMLTYYLCMALSTLTLPIKAYISLICAVLGLLWLVLSVLLVLSAYMRIYIPSDENNVQKSNK